MSNEIDLKQIERRAFTSTFQDGLVEMDIGIMIMGGGFNMTITNFFDSSWFALLFIVYGIVGFMTFFLGKKYITNPRLGVAKFGPKRTAAHKKLLMITLLFVIATTILVILTANNLLQQSLFVGIGGIIIISLLIVTLPISIIAYHLNFTRLYAIAVLCGLAWPFDEVLRSFTGSPFRALISYGLFGGSLLIMGLIYLLRFIRKYPLPSKEIADAPQ
ncbi:MAG: hypothetical protein HWN65_04065 [Candidatus Helarchaeota archaeon]|nr:hypothetical protein [Candidatus Helarchaeota archaeon]